MLKASVPIACGSGIQENNSGVDGCGETQKDPLEAADKQPLSDERHWNLTSILCSLASDETDHLGFCLHAWYVNC